MYSVPAKRTSLADADQQPFIDLVNHILNEFQTHGHHLPSAAAARVAAWEQEIDAKVDAIYGIAPNDVGAIAAVAPTWVRAMIMRMARCRHMRYHVG
jgi:hypothetical protein